MNLREETEERMEKLGRTWDDVTFIGSDDGTYGMSVEEFLVVADVEYSSGYGAQEVAADLTIVFSDGIRMFRMEYDGAEWWSHTPPVTPAENPMPIRTLTGGMWSSIRNLNDGGDLS